MNPQIKWHVGGLPPDKYLSPGQIDKVIIHLRHVKQSERNAVNMFAVVMLLYTGLRSEELLNLRLRDLPPYHGKAVVMVKKGKGCISRTVLVPDWLGSVMQQFIRDHRKGGKPGSFLLTAEGTSAPMTYSGLYRRIVRIGKLSGVGRLTPHCLRHTYGMNLHDLCKDLDFVCQQLGHSHVETTRIYAKTRPQSGRAQVEALPFFGVNDRKVQEFIGKQPLNEITN
jgi:integrase/recombinase XerD